MIPSVWRWHRLFGLSIMFIFTVLGFAAQLIFIASVISIAISCVSLPHSCIVVTSEDHPSGAESLYSVEGLDAMLPITSSFCAKSMVSLAYTTTIDEPVVSPDDFSTMTIRQLKALCKSRSVKSYSYLRKHELIELLSAL